MRIRVVKEDRALAPFVWDDVPNFAVITGLNGAGKSQLLQAIHTAFNRRKNTTVVVEEFTTDSKRVIGQTSEWELTETSAAGVGTIDTTKRQLWTSYEEKRDGHDELFLRLEKRVGVERWQLTEEQFSRALVMADLVPHVRALSEHISQLYVDHSLREIEAKLHNRAAPTSVPPWDTMEAILRASELPYESNRPTGELLVPFRFQLTHTSLGKNVPLSGLSSGEQVILSTALWAFGSDMTDVTPSLLLLDEPDAHLHPSMVRPLLRVIQDVFVEKLGAKVIMTTHSATTVALAPEESILLMEMPGHHGERIRRISKDQAIGILTAGLSTLRVHHQNQRQVFVESENDVGWYRKLYESASDHLDEEIGLNFIPSGRRSGEPGSCSRVTSLVRDLRDHGVETVFGIVDRDSKNKSEGGVFVLGERERYCIENFVLDPVGVGVLLLSQHLCDSTELGLLEGTRGRDVAGFTDEQLQTVADHVLRKLADALDEDDEQETEKIEVTTVAGHHLKLPTWFCNLHGETTIELGKRPMKLKMLEAKYREAFPKLNECCRGRGLVDAVLELVFSEYPELVPEAVLDTFRKIQRSRLLESEKREISGGPRTSSDTTPERARGDGDAAC